jgi:ABC-type sugar transport system ATPase subunit
VAAITLQGVTRALSGGRWEAHLTGSERGVRRGTTTFAEDLPEPAPGGAGRALDGVDLEVRDRETLAIIGPSGCGKSTLLRVVAGLEPVDSGRVLYDGQDVSAVPPGERGIGMVFQNYALYPHMESRGNLGFFFRLRRRREEEIDERVRLTAEIMGLGFDELLERKPGTLSGGQQQRVAIGRCIARDPRLFLLDEPLSSLDARLRARTRVELKRLLTRFRITTIYVTHDQTEALALATRIAVMRRGRIEQTGTWDELYQRPASAFVAGFVGTPGSPPANLLPGTVSAGRARLAAGALALPPALRGLPEGEKVLLAVRPEHLVVAPGADPGGAEAAGEPEDGALWGVVEAVEPLIAERAQLVHVLPDGAPSGAAGPALTARAPLAPPLSRGQRVRLRVDPQQLLLFDAATERALAPG